jgi:hypothetical protein
MRKRCPQPKMVLRSISSLNDSGFSKVMTKDECFLLPIWSVPHNHLGSSFRLMFANHGLSARSVLIMCDIG